MNVEKLAYSIAEFCVGIGICRATFYEMEKLGETPKTIKIGKRRIITAAAIEDWRNERENPQPRSRRVRLA